MKITTIKIPQPEMFNMLMVTLNNLNIKDKENVENIFINLSNVLIGYTINLINSMDTNIGLEQVFNDINNVLQDNSVIITNTNLFNNLINESIRIFSSYLIEADVYRNEVYVSDYDFFTSTIFITVERKED